LSIWIVDGRPSGVQLVTYRVLHSELKTVARHLRFASGNGRLA